MYVYRKLKLVKSLKFESFLVALGIPGILNWTITSEAIILQNCFISASFASTYKIVISISTYISSGSLNYCLTAYDKH